MALTGKTIGIIGGSGMLGSAIAQGLLDRAEPGDGKLWLSNTSGQDSRFDSDLRVRVTADNQALAEACDIVILSVPPAQFRDIAISAKLPLVVSVMAGVRLDDIGRNTQAERYARAMSSPSAALGLAYSPWCASDKVTDEDRSDLHDMFGACGTTDEIPDEAQMDHFTAMTGPVPGFVAYFAQCMVDHAVAQGIEPRVADRAIRQLFLASGTMLAQGADSPADHVRQMIDYAGTTAAGLVKMRDSDLSRLVSEGLGAAAEKARRIAN